MLSPVKRINYLRKARRVLGQPIVLLPSERKELARWEESHPWVQEVLQYFAKDTTEKILANMDEMQVSPMRKDGVEYTGNLLRSIHWTIVNGAGGDETLINFYYLKYGDYLGISASGWLTWNRDGTPNTTYGPIKPGMVPPMTDLSGVPVPALTEGMNRPWRAKPFINSEIRRKSKKLARRLARQFCYAGGMQIVNSFVPASDPNHEKYGLEFWEYVKDQFKSGRQ